MEAADADPQYHDRHDQKRQGLVPEFKEPKAFKDNTPDDLNVVSQWDEVTEVVNGRRHRFSGENKTT